MKKKKILEAISMIIMVILVIGVAIFLRSAKKDSKVIEEVKDEIREVSASVPLGGTTGDKDEKCKIEKEEKIVRGNSLEGLVNDGQTIKVLKDYYECNSVQRGDIVIYNYSASKEPIIKIIKGLPGDNFELQNNGSGKYNILVNNKILKISTGQPYELSEAKHKMLALYEKDYKGIIPNDAYLILGNQVGGSLDSTRFGLVGKEGFIGKVVKE